MVPGTEVQNGRRPKIANQVIVLTRYLRHIVRGIDSDWHSINLGDNAIPRSIGNDLYGAPTTYYNNPIYLETIDCVWGATFDAAHSHAPVKSFLLPPWRTGLDYL